MERCWRELYCFYVISTFSILLTKTSSELHGTSKFNYERDLIKESQEAFGIKDYPAMIVFVGQDKKKFALPRALAGQLSPFLRAKDHPDGITIAEIEEDEFAIIARNIAGVSPHRLADYINGVEATTKLVRAAKILQMHRLSGIIIQRLIQKLVQGYEDITEVTLSQLQDIYSLCTSDEASDFLCVTRKVVNGAIENDILEMLDREDTDERLKAHLAIVMSEKQVDFDQPI